MSDTPSFGTFQTVNGEIIGPSGQPYVAAGIDVIQGQEPSVSTLKADFPTINFVRYAIYNYASPASLEAYVDSLTSAGIVVELEDHTNSIGQNAGGGAGTIFTGSELTTELSWYSSIASAFADNPYVWFGTDNEPSDINPATGQPDPALLSQWQQETYNAVRDTGNMSPILLEDAGATNLVASYYAGMTNTIWDDHYYGWVSGYSTSQTTVSASLAGTISQIQQIQGANGTMPVLIGEYGNSTDGQTIDPDANQVITAAENAVQSGEAAGSAAWAWGPGSPADGLSNGGTGLSAYGQQIASVIATEAAAGDPPPTSPPGPSPTDTVVRAGATAAIIDASSNKWTITASATVDENGTAAGYSADVTEIAYVGTTVWQENTSDNWYSWTGTTWSGGTTTSPLPATPTPTPTDTVVRAGSTAAIIDASSNKWTITASATVDENGTAAGYSADVTEIAYVGTTVWQENTSDNWYSWTGTTWSGGTATSPLPATPAPTPAPTPTPRPSPTDTVVRAGSSAAIIDASSNKWTITASATVDENATAAGYSADVTEIAYVGTTVWQENTSDNWYSWTGTTWSGGTTTSPLPATPAPTPASTPTPRPSPTDTILIPGSSGTITDASGNVWTISTSDQVAVNGITDATTANVTELAYVDGDVWQENAGNLWWAKTSPAAAWGPSAGTSASPLPTPASEIVVTGGTVAAASDLNATMAGAYTLDGSAISLTAPGAATVTVGGTTTMMQFIGMASVHLIGGSAAATITQDVGTGTYTVGTGAMNVTGGTGADNYVFGAGSGSFTISDFSAAKGDVLTIAQSLQGAATIGLDGSGGILLTFGTAAGDIDLKNTASVPISAIHFA